MKMIKYWRNISWENVKKHIKINFYFVGIILNIVFKYNKKNQESFFIFINKNYLKKWL